MQDWNIFFDSEVRRPLIDFTFALSVMRAEEIGHAVENFAVLNEVWLCSDSLMMLIHDGISTGNLQIASKCIEGLENLREAYSKLLNILYVCKEHSKEHSINNPQQDDDENSIHDMKGDEYVYRHYLECDFLEKQRDLENKRHAVKGYIYPKETAQWLVRQIRGKALLPPSLVDFLMGNVSVPPSQANKHAGSAKDLARMTAVDEAFASLRPNLEAITHHNGLLYQNDFLRALQEKAGDEYHDRHAKEIWREKIPQQKKGKGRKPE